MRLACALVLLVGTIALAQEPPPPIIPKEPPPRYGVPSKSKTYPQTSPKRVLESALEAIDNGEFTYLTAHLLDPTFVDARIVERAKNFEAVANRELTMLRDLQQANADRIAPEDRLPLDRAQFHAVVIARSRERAFAQIARDLDEKLRDDPQSLRDLRRIWRAGTFTDEGAGAKAVHPTVKDRAVFFKRSGDRWFLENRMEETARKEVKD
jgi:hypothetical protein